MKTSTKEPLNGHFILKEDIDIILLEKIWKIDNPNFTFSIVKDCLSIKGDYIEYVINGEVAPSQRFYYLIGKYLGHLRDNKINEIFENEG